MSEFGFTEDALGETLDSAEAGVHPMAIAVRANENTVVKEVRFMVVRLYPMVTFGSTSCASIEASFYQGGIG